MGVEVAQYAQGYALSLVESGSVVAGIIISKSSD